MRSVGGLNHSKLNYYGNRNSRNNRTERQRKGLGEGSVRSDFEDSDVGILSCGKESRKVKSEE